MIAGARRFLLLLSLTCAFSFPSLSQAENVPSQSQSEGLDARLFKAINRSHNPAKDGVFEWIDRGAIPAFFLVPITYSVVSSLDHGYIDNSSFLFLVTQSLSLGISAGMKAVIVRPRPFETLQGVKTKHEWSAIGSSFPSGHAAQAFSIATFLALRHKSLLVTVPAFLWAGTVSYGRIYLGLHYPSDVLGGALLGTGIAVLVWSFKDDLIGFKNRIFSSDDVQLFLGEQGGGHSIRIVRISFAL